MSSGRRIAIVGGDERAERVLWPKGYDLRFFVSSRASGPREMERLEKACTAGSIAFVIWLARWNAHSSVQKVKALAPTVIWERGLGELAKALPEIAQQRGVLKKEPIKTVEPVSETLLDATPESEPILVPREVEHAAAELFPHPPRMNGVSEAISVSENHAIEEKTTTGKSRGLSWTEDEVAALQLAAERGLRGKEVAKLFEELCPGRGRSLPSLLCKRGELSVAGKIAKFNVADEKQARKIPFNSSFSGTWLPQGEASRAAGLTRAALFTGHAAEKIRRKEGIGGVWLYSVSDAATYASSWGKAGVDETGRAYDQIVAWARRRHDDLLRGEARGLGRYVRVEGKGQGKRVVAILTSTFSALGKESGFDPHSIARELARRGFLLSERPGKLRRKTSFGRNYRPWAYFIVLPGDPVEIPVEPPKELETIDEEVAAAPEAAIEKVEASFEKVVEEVEEEKIPISTGNEVSVDVTVLDEEEWLSQADASRRSGLAISILKNGSVLGKVRRTFDEAIATWKYSLRDAVAYAHARGDLVPSKRQDEKKMFKNLMRILPSSSENTTSPSKDVSPLVAASFVRGRTKAKVLADIRDHPGTRPGEIAQRVGGDLTAKYVSVILTHAIRQGLVIWEGARGDRRYRIAGSAPSALFVKENVSTTEENLVVQDIPASSETVVEDAVLSSRDLSSEEDLHLVEVIEAAGALVDAGMLGAERAFQMVREKVAKMRNQETP